MTAPKLQFSKQIIIRQWVRNASIPPSTRRIQHRPAFSSLACRRSQFCWHHQCVERVYTRATLVVVAVSAKQTHTQHATRQTRFAGTLSSLSLSLSLAYACWVCTGYWARYAMLSTWMCEPARVRSPNETIPFRLGFSRLFHQTCDSATRNAKRT